MQTILIITIALLLFFILCVLSAAVGYLKNIDKNIQLELITRGHLPHGYKRSEKEGQE